MYNVDEATQVISIGLIVASFLLNTNRFLKAIELCKESLFTLEERAGIKDQKLSKLFYKSIYSTMWRACSLINDNTNAIIYAEKLLQIYCQNGERLEECKLSTELTGMYLHDSKYAQAKQLSKKALLISTEIGDSKLEACCHGNLGTIYQSVDEYEKARQHLEKSLAIQKETGDKRGEAASYANLGAVFISVGEYERARQHLEKSLAIQKETGDRRGEATSCANLGAVFRSVGEYEKAREYLKKSLVIQKEIEDRRGEAASCANLGAVFHSVGEYEKAREHLEKSLAIQKEIGDRNGEATSYGYLGTVYTSFGEYGKAVHAHTKGKEYFEKALTISKEIGNWKLQADGCLKLGHFFLKQAKYERAEQYIEKGLTLSKEIGYINGQFLSLELMAHLRMRDGKIQEAISYFLSGIEKCEEMRSSLRDNDQFKISFSDRNIRSYRDLSTLICAIGSPTEALCVSEFSKARALADLMSALYSVPNQISADPRTWLDLESIVGKEYNGTCLYVSYHSDTLYLWILKAGGVTHLQTINGNDLIALEGLTQQLEEFFDFRHFGRGASMNLPIFYKLIIAPVARFLEGPEIIIVPDRALYQIPFAALTDESGKYLSETFRIRIAPSLTTLKLINESPVNYHCQTGALIVGNPDVGEVHFKGRLVNISPLPCAENEVRMVGEKLGVEPLLGQQATKQAVLQAMNSVSLIHIAAHSDAERGAIALAPSFRIPNSIPQEGLYLLTMSDISKVQLQAKLVVLSCDYSACGEIKAEGAVGIARAFLGSGARSVLVALWALEDEATEQLMTHFYDHLVAGRSAGESLHDAMKWMRRMGYDVNQWAPFILIGDDVTFDFGKKGKINSVAFFFPSKGRLV